MQFLKGVRDQTSEALVPTNPYSHCIYLDYCVCSIVQVGCMFLTISSFPLMPETESHEGKYCIGGDASFLSCVQWMRLH